MKILLIGGCSSFINNIIIKMKKEGHRVYLITGSRYNKKPYQRVFERYDFPYDTNCLNEIFESVAPDITIYMGAYDSNYNWKDEEAEAVRYNACMLNIIMAYIMGKKGRFIYLSSEEVFEGNYESRISEEESPQARSFKNMVLAQAETMCENYKQSYDRDIVVLRMERVYTIPEYVEDITDRCSKKVLQCLESNVMTVDAGFSYSMLYVTDAVECIYKLVICKEHKQSLYNISSEMVISDETIAAYIKNYMGDNIQTVNVTNGEKKKLLSADLYTEEFGRTGMCSYDEIIRKITAKMKKYKHVFLYGERKRKSIIDRMLEGSGWLIKAMVPFIENLIVFILFFMINNRAVGSRYFDGIDFYLLYVLLFAIVYGQKQAILSACLAVLGYCFRQMYDRSGLELMVDSTTYIWIAQLFILGLIIGYMRDYITKLTYEKKHEKEFLDTQLVDIKEINDSNVRVKDALEVQIVNQNDSVGKIYSITSSLDQYSQEEVLFYAAEMVAKIVKSKDVAIYTVANDVYARLFSATSKIARKLGNSIKYTEMTEIYEDLKAKKVYINSKLDENYPLMASAIFDDKEEIQTIIMIWDIPWQNMTLGQANQLTVIGALIRDAVIRANKYMQALEKERYIENTSILENEAFTTLLNAYMNARKNGLTECMLLRMQGSGMGLEDVSRILSEKLREHDYVGQLKDGSICILLSNTTKEDALQVAKRLADIGYVFEIVEEYGY